jgi:hypothetical protein
MLLEPPMLLLLLAGFHVPAVQVFTLPPLLVTCSAQNSKEPTRRL